MRPEDVTDEDAWSIVRNAKLQPGPEAAYMAYCDASLSAHMDPGRPLCEEAGGIWWLDGKRRTLGEIRSRYSGANVFCMDKRQTFSVLSRAKKMEVDTGGLLHSLASLDMPFPSIFVPMFPVISMAVAISDIITGRPICDMEGRSVPSGLLLDRQGIVLTVLLACQDGGHTPRHLEVLRFGDGRSTCMERPMCDVLESYGAARGIKTLGEFIAPYSPYMLSVLEWACYSRSKRSKPSPTSGRRANATIRQIEDIGASLWRVVGPMRDPGPVRCAQPTDIKAAHRKCAHSRRAHYRWLTKRGRWPAKPPEGWDVFRRGDNLGAFAEGLSARHIKPPGLGEWLAVKIVRVRHHDVSGYVDNRLTIRKCGDRIK